jgi:CBS-domain-containing membrane protein
MRATTRCVPMLTLGRLTAEDLMTENPVSIRESLTAREALGFLLDRGISAAPVTDEAGHPVGVISQTDLLVHDREAVEHLAPPEYESGRPFGPRDWEGFQIERADGTCVRDLMTPAVFAVNPKAPARRIVEQMCELGVHRLYVVDGGGVLVGVISSLDLLRSLRPAAG